MKFVIERIELEYNEMQTVVGPPLVVSSEGLAHGRLILADGTQLSMSTPLGPADMVMIERLGEHLAARVVQQVRESQPQAP